MTSAQQQAFLQARSRIERNLAEVAALAQDGRLSPADFFQRFLALALESIDAMGGAVWAVEGGQASRLAELSFGSSGYSSPRQKEWVDKVLSHTVATAKSCIVAVQEQPAEGTDGVGNEAPHPFFYTPVVVDGNVVVVLQVWLKQAGDPRSYADIAAFLAGLAQQACLFLRGVYQVRLSRSAEDAQNRLRFQNEMLGELDPKVLCETAANHLVDILGCPLSAIFQRRGKAWKLVAASNQEVVDPKAAQSKALSAVAELMPDNGGAGFYSCSRLDGSPASELSGALDGAGYTAATWCHLPSSKNAPRHTLIVGCWHTAPQSQESARAGVAWIAAQLAKALDAATHFHHIPFRPIATRISRVFRAWHENRRRRVAVRVLLPALVFLGAMIFPVSYKIKGECSVVPAQTATVVAETDGKVVEVLAPEGAAVKAGDVLARLEDTDYETQLAVSAQQLARGKVEAVRAQTLGNEAERKVAELGVKREEENMKRLQYQRSRTVLRSPIDGIVLTRSVQHREGEAMQIGKIFCQVGSAGSFQLQIDLRQQDLGIVLRALRERGVLPVDFILHSHPRTPLRGELSSADQVSQLPEMRQTETVFTARFPLDPSALDSDGGLKAGYTGKASILLGRRPWGWLLLRPFLQYLRMNWSL